MPSFYETLEINQFATFQEIKKQHKKLLVKYHPAMNPENQSRFIEIMDAHETLKDKKKRFIYDVSGKELLDRFRDPFKAGILFSVVNPPNILMMLAAVFLYSLYFFMIPIAMSWIFHTGTKYGHIILASFTIIPCFLAGFTIRRIVLVLTGYQSRFYMEVRYLHMISVTLLAATIQAICIATKMEFFTKMPYVVSIIPICGYILALLWVKFRRNFKYRINFTKGDVKFFLAVLGVMGAITVVCKLSFGLKLKSISLALGGLTYYNIMSKKLGRWYNVIISVCALMYIMGCMSFENIRHTILCKILLFAPYYLVWKVLNVVAKEWQKIIPNSGKEMILPLKAPKQ